ncbi:Cysteine--tRNA ligase [Alphaproteobacteria bacterium]
MIRYNLLLTNSLTHKKELFQPIDPQHVKMYVCGPTVYDRPHLGNVRSAVVYDVLLRLLLHIYRKVTYVRNITDIDDKIINAANENNCSIAELTAVMTNYYQQDVRALNCLSPDIEPRATAHLKQMFAMITKLIEKKHAYVAEQHVLFDIQSYQDYGNLSKRSLDEMIAGARIEVASYKKHPADFVLWKPAKLGEGHCSFDSPWGCGRPGWHIECSAMSAAYLGADFDIHGGGADLMFPHHENEIAQSRCAAPGSNFAKYWVHNGFLTVEGEKMSKSLGNFKTARDVLDKGVPGCVIRYLYLTAHYRKPLDYTNKAIHDAYKAIERFSSTLNKRRDMILQLTEESLVTQNCCKEIIKILCDDLNTPAALAYLHQLALEVKDDNDATFHKLAAGCILLGLDITQILNINTDITIPVQVIKFAEERQLAKFRKEWAKADNLRSQIIDLGYSIQDTADGYKLHKTT